MPFESFADASGVAWWSQDPKLLLEKLESMEALLALLALALVALLCLAIRMYRSRRSSVGDDAHEIVRLTSQGPIHVGARAKLAVFGGEEPSQIGALIEEMDRKWIMVSVPHSEAPRLRPGVSVEIISPAGPAAFRFTAIIQDQRKRDDCLLIFLDRPAWVERVQRRSYFRVPLDLPTVITRVDAETPSNTAFRAVLHDLSGGGMTVSLPFKPPLGALLRVRIPLPTLKNASFEVRVLRAAPARMVHGGMWAAGCEFLLMNEVVQEQVMKACFEVERAAKAKAQ